jgi:DNA-binding winged helix-turn-helix (wHTH) protein
MFTHLPFFEALTRLGISVSLIATMPGKGYEVNIPLLVEAISAAYAQHGPG